MSLTFQREDLLIPPGTLRAWQGPEALKFRSVIAAECDNLVLTAQFTGEARNPLKCHSSVLPLHAADRKIRQYENEGEASWRLRLAKWRQIWGSAGRAWGILRQLRILLAPFGRPRLRYVSTSGDGLYSQWFTLEPGDGSRDHFLLGGLDPEFSCHLQTPANWVWDAATAAWSRFWLIIYTDGASAPADGAIWGGPDTWGDGSLWGDVFTAGAIDDAVSLAQEWSAAHSQLHGVIVTSDPNAYNPTGSGPGYPSGFGYQYAAPDGTPQHPPGASIVFNLGMTEIV